MCTAFGDRGGWGRDSTHPAGQKINMVAWWFDHHMVATSPSKIKDEEETPRQRSFVRVWTYPMRTSQVCRQRQRMMAAATAINTL